MSFYADYMKEREGIETMETDHGFAMFKINGTECYIIDIYVTPEARRQRVCFDMADAIVLYAKGQGCTHLVGSVAPGTAGATASLKLLLAYGMSVHSIDAPKNLIMFLKEI